MLETKRRTKEKRNQLRISIHALNIPINNTVDAALKRRQLLTPLRPLPRHLIPRLTGPAEQRNGQNGRDHVCHEGVENARGEGAVGHG